MYGDTSDSEENCEEEEVDACGTDDEWASHSSKLCKEQTGNPTFVSASAKTSTAELPTMPCPMPWQYPFQHNMLNNHQHNMLNNHQQMPKPLPVANKEHLNQIAPPQGAGKMIMELTLTS